MNKIIRFRFRKGEELRFLSHLDLIRTLERAIRRAQLPMAYSEGFNPRPKMSFSFPLAVGLMSTGEYGDYELVEDLDPQDFLTRYNAVLPCGLEILEAQTLLEGTKTLMSSVNFARYELVVPKKTKALMAKRWSYLKSQDSFSVERKTKKGLRKLDVLPFLLDLSIEQELEDSVVISCLCSVGNEANLRMEELGALLEFAYLDAKITRTAQLIKDGCEYYPPLRSEAFK